MALLEQEITLEELPESGGYDLLPAGWYNATIVKSELKSTKNADGQYNCGACEKCVRTAVAIRLAGVEGQFATLPPPSLRQIAAVDIRGLGSTWHGYADELRRSGASPRLRRAIDLALARHRLRSAPGLGRWLR